LWASTSTKNPNYGGVLYAEELIGPDMVILRVGGKSIGRPHLFGLEHDKCSLTAPSAALWGEINLPPDSLELTAAEAESPFSLWTVLGRRQSPWYAPASDNSEGQKQSSAAIRQR
jgi:hypothetical protein